MKLQIINFYINLVKLIYRNLVVFANIVCALLNYCNIFATIRIKLLHNLWWTKDGVWRSVWKKMGWEKCSGIKPGTLGASAAALPLHYRSASEEWIMLISVERKNSLKYF